MLPFALLVPFCGYSSFRLPFASFRQIFRALNKVFKTQKQRQESDEEHDHSDRVQSIPRPTLILPIGR